MTYMRRRAIDFVSGERRWTQIEALVKALLEEGVLSRDRAIVVCRQALGRAGVTTIGTREPLVEDGMAKLDDRADALANLLIGLFPPESIRQQFYLDEFAQRAVAQIEEELPSVE
jgi:hypothetical protein